MKLKLFELFGLFVVVLTGCVIDSSDHNNADWDRTVLQGSRFPMPVQLTAEDIEWFRDFGALWILSENGAPALVPPTMTYEDYFKLYEGGDDPQQVLRQFERVFITFAVYGQLRPGRYSLDSNKVVGNLPSGLVRQTYFTLTSAHIKLLQSAWWRNGFIDFKYPYGSYRFYEADMAIKLGKKVPINATTGAFELSLAERKEYQQLHKELLYAVLIFVQHAQITPGHYQLPVDGWESAFVRFEPPHQRQISSYLENAIRLKNSFANGKGDRVLGWIELNKQFAEVLD